MYKRSSSWRTHIIGDWAGIEFLRVNIETPKIFLHWTHVINNPEFSALLDITTTSVFYGSNPRSGILTLGKNVCINTGILLRLRFFYINQFIYHNIVTCNHYKNIRSYIIKANSVYFLFFSRMVGDTIKIKYSEFIIFQILIFLF